MKQSLPSNWKCCATCREWDGTRKPDSFYSFVEFDTNDKGQCFNGALSLGTTAAQQMCSNWEQQYKK